MQNQHPQFQGLPRGFANQQTQQQIANNSGKQINNSNQYTTQTAGMNVVPDGKQNQNQSNQAGQFQRPGFNSLAPDNRFSSLQQPEVRTQLQGQRPLLSSNLNQLNSQSIRPQSKSHQNLQQMQQPQNNIQQPPLQRPQLNPNLMQRPLSQRNNQLQSRAQSQQNLQQIQNTQLQQQQKLNSDNQVLNGGTPQQPMSLSRNSVTSQSSQPSQTSSKLEGAQSILRNQPAQGNLVRPQLNQQLQSLNISQQSPQKAQAVQVANKPNQLQQQQTNLPPNLNMQNQINQRSQLQQGQSGPLLGNNRPQNINQGLVRPQLQQLRPLGQLPVRNQPLTTPLQRPSQSLPVNNQMSQQTIQNQQQPQQLMPQQQVPQQQISQQQYQQPQQLQGQGYPIGNPSQQGQQKQGINNLNQKPDFMKQQSMDYASYQQQVQNQQSRGAGGMDPSQIPRPEYDDTLQVYYTSNFANSPRKGKRQPPPASSNYAMIDDGSCSVAYVRCSTHVFPQSREVGKTTHIPLCVSLTPLAKVNEQESDIPVIDFGEVGPMRCSMQGCRGYMNPFNQFIEHGRKWVCVFCNHVNETPQDQVCDIDAQGIRRDAHSRPDFSCGSVEYVAYEEYQQRPPMLPDHFFMIENTRQAVLAGVTSSCLGAIAEVFKASSTFEMEGMPSERSRVGLGLYDETAVSFYSFINEIPQQIVVGDIDDVFSPPIDLVLQPLELVREQIIQFCQNKIIQLQTSIDQNPHGGHKKEACSGAAIGAGIEVLQVNGGKLHAFVYSLPNRGQFQLRPEDGQEGTKYLSMTNGERDRHKHTLLVPSTEYQALAKFAAEQQVSIDVALFGLQEYINVASLSKLATSTGGTIYPYRDFKPNFDFQQVYDDLKNNLTREQGLEAVMRLRSSQGVSVKNYFGNFYRRTTSDVDFPAIDCTKSIMVELKHETKMQEDERVFLQAALLYSTPSGERRIRIHTQQLPISSAVSTVFLGTDQEVVVNYMAHVAGQKLVEGKNLEEAREFQYNTTVNLLLAYRKHCSSESRAGQLVLPESLKNLPSYVLGLMKSDAFKNCYSSFDDRALFIGNVQGLLLANFTGLTYPRLFDLQNLENVDIKNFKAQIPIPSEPLRSDTLFSTGVYLLENGQDIYIYADKHVNEEFLEKLFGYKSLQEFEDNIENMTWFGKQVEQNGHSNGTPQIDMGLYEKVLKLFTLVRQKRQAYMRLRILRRSDPQVTKFFELLYEDKSKPGPAIVEFLTNLHRSITQLSE